MSVSDSSYSEWKPKTLFNSKFIALLITQFTVAFNDNAFRWLLIPIGKAYADTNAGEDSIRFLGAFFLVVPFLLWAPIAGYVTDRFSRRKTVIWCKTIELILLAAAVGVIGFGPPVSSGSGGMPITIYLLLGILFLSGSQSAFFSPSKYGLIPDLVPESSISTANGIVMMFTMFAIVFGTIVGGYVFAWTTLFQDVSNAAGIMEKTVLGIPGGQHIWITALVLVGVAGIGLLSSFFIPKMNAVDPNAKFPKNPLRQTGKDLAALFSHGKLFWVAIASAFFWGLSALAQNNVDKYATEFLMVPQEHVTPLFALLIIGIGIGAVLCGYLSNKRIEMGLVPIGAFFMGFFMLILGFTPSQPMEIGRGFGSPFDSPYLFAVVFVFLAGLGAGLYDVPLAAYIQKNSPKAQRGRMIAAYNFCTFSAVIVFAGLGLFGAVLFAKLGLNASIMIWIATGLLTLAVSAALTYQYAGALQVFAVRSLVKIIYRPKYIGTENIPAEGGALLVSNHVSLLDGFMVYTASPRNIRFLAYELTAPKFFEPCARETRLIKILPGNPKNIVRAIKEARQALKNGEIVGIFAEGGITRNGQIKGFEPGFLSILKGNEDIPVIPVHIGGLFGSMFSYKYGDKEHNGANITLKPRRLDNDVIVSFGKPIYAPKTPQQVQLAVQELGVDNYAKYNEKLLPAPAITLIRTARKRGRKLMFADTGGTSVSGYKFLTAVLIAKKLLQKYVLDTREKEPHVGVLAPMSVGGCVLNGALVLARRVSVNLNFTFGADGMNHCIRQAGVKTVLTSRKLLERFPNLKLDAKIICAEDLLGKISLYTKLDTFLDVLLLPNWWHERILKLRAKEVHNELCTLIYTSGSTGKPKGVMLTNYNLAEVGRSTVETLKMSEKEIVLGFLPFFHSFGLMGNFWLPLFMGGAGVIHFNPLEPKKVGAMAKKYAITFLPSTPTFLRNFLRSCPKEDFAHIQSVTCGAERLPLDLIEAWEEKYGQRPTEGFGATELSPLPACNLTNDRIRDTFHTYRKDGSVGRALYNIAAKIVDLDTGEDMPPNEIGMLVVKGP
ncbi:MAG: MFS transporter, partial [Planctomycetaceae bacterium]|nr:MFS transporter [Planctomycetaceae bacterium]